MAVPADALLTASGVQRAESVHNKWLDEVGLARMQSVQLKYQISQPPQIQSGIPVPTVFYSSPLTRTLRTLEITWTGITLPYNSDRSHLHACHKVVVDEVRAFQQTSVPPRLYHITRVELS